MVNAALIATELAQAFPKEMTPENTEGREGFIHLHAMKGDVDSATLEYIIRDHDIDKLHAMEKRVEDEVNRINEKYGNRATVKIKESYHNMKEVLDKNPEAVDIARSVLEEMGLDIVNEPVRGGTDGAMLSFMGLPCPNLGCGGGNFHGPYEYCVIDELETSIDVIINIVKKVGELS